MPLIIGLDVGAPTRPSRLGPSAEERITNEAIAQASIEMLIKQRKDTAGKWKCACSSKSARERSAGGLEGAAAAAAAADSAVYEGRLVELVAAKREQTQLVMSAQVVARQAQARRWATEQHPKGCDWSKGKWCVAVHDSGGGAGGGDIELLKGDLVELAHGKPKRWWHGRNARTGLSGEFPSNFVRLLKKAKALETHAAPPAGAMLRFKAGDVMLLLDWNKQKQQWLGFPPPTTTGATIVPLLVCPQKIWVEPSEHAAGAACPEGGTYECDPGKLLGNT